MATTAKLPLFAVLRFGTLFLLLLCGNAFAQTSPAPADAARQDHLRLVGDKAGGGDDDLVAGPDGGDVLTIDRFTPEQARAAWALWHARLPTTLALVNPKAGSFNVTAKGGLVERGYFDWRISGPYLLLMLANHHDGHVWNLMRQQAWLRSKGYPTTPLRRITKAESDRGILGFIAHGEHRVLVGTAFDAGEEIG